MWGQNPTGSTHYKQVVQQHWVQCTKPLIKVEWTNTSKKESMWHFSQNKSWMSFEYHFKYSLMSEFFKVELSIFEFFCKYYWVDQLSNQLLKQEFAERYSFSNYNGVLQVPLESNVHVIVCTEVLTKSPINHHFHWSAQWWSLSQTKYRYQLGDTIIFTLKVNTSIVLKRQIPFWEKAPVYMWPALISLLAFNENIPDNFQITHWGCTRWTSSCPGFQWIS